MHEIACLGEGFGDSNEIRTKGSYVFLLPPQPPCHV